VFPWLYFWAPVFHFPYSGAVNQHIQPQTDWFIRNVLPGAGVADIEREVVLRKASYGHQLGHLIDAVLEIAERVPVTASGGQPDAVQTLRGLQAQIEAVKAEVRADSAAEARAALRRLSDSDPEVLAALLAEFRQR
jgi:hypothetical protein